MSLGEMDALDCLCGKDYELDLTISKSNPQYRASPIFPQCSK